MRTVELPDVSKIAVLTGGRSGERDRSILSGTTVESALRNSGFETVFIDVADRRSISLLPSFDVAFLAIAGQYAEDGKLQGCLETMGVPYTGSGVLASAIGMNKIMFKDVLRIRDIPVLADSIIDFSDNSSATADRLVSSIGLPVILKPISDGGSIDMHVASSFEELTSKISSLSSSSKDIMVERFVSGRSLTVGVLDRQGVLQCLPVLEIESSREFYDYTAKRNPALHTYHCPAELSPGITKNLQDLALRAHKAIGCHGVSRVDFILKDNMPYVLEVNTLPGLSRSGNLATMATEAGFRYEELLDSILKSAFTKPVYAP